MADTPRISLNFTPRHWQSEAAAHIARHPRSTLVVSRRQGKTYLSCAFLCNAAMAAPNQQLAYFATTMKAARTISWAIFRELCQDIPEMQWRVADGEIVFPNGSSIRVYSGMEHDSSRGHGFDGIVMDEFAEYPASAWQSSISPTVADREGWVLAIGTVRQPGDQFHAFFQKGQDKEAKDWWSGLYTVHDCGIFTPRQIEMARESAMSDQSFAREYLCDWNAGLADTLIPAQQIVEAMSRGLPSPQHRTLAPKIIALDAARWGGDQYALAKRWGKHVYPLKMFDQGDQMHMVGVISQEVADFDADAVIVDGTGGYGSGVIDRLRQLGGIDVFEVNFGSKANNERFANLRMEMYAKLRDWIREGGSLPSDTQLMGELAAPTFSFTASNKMQLMKKEDIRKSLGRSPDRADAVALCFAVDHIQPKLNRFETRIEAKWHRHQQEKQRRAALDYDPLEADW